MTREAPPVALGRLVRRNRRRYGGYIVHAGLAVLLIGVAGSSSFQHSSQVTLVPGRSATVDGYTVRYVRPLEQASLSKLSFGAVLDVSKGGKHVTTLTTSRGFYPAPNDPTLGPISDVFNGQADSQVGLQAGLTHDIWTIVNPDLTPLQPLIAKGDKVFEQLMMSLTPAQAARPATRNWIVAQRLGAIGGLAARFVSHPWPIQFLLIVSPLVTWIWLGAIVMAFGALVALWPLPALALRKARATAPVHAAGRRLPAREPA
jgi:cytochrome c-type biogenesis protein CcmF